jgi:23S rRNA (uracil1939-C5)-methyltransferase
VTRDSAGRARARGARGPTPVVGVVERLVPGGAGVVRVEKSGAALLAAGVAPGERVEVEPGKPARLLRVLEAGAARVVPACPYLARCGACDWMHLAEDAQLREHAELVRGVVAHALGDTAVPAIVSHRAQTTLAYRTRARLFVSSRGGQVRVGYRAVGSREIAAVDACAVLAPSIAGMLTDLAATLAGSRGEGDAHVALGAGGAPVVALSFRGELAACAWSQIDARVTGGAWAGARVTLDGVAKPATFGDPRVVVRAADGVDLVTPPGAFAQPSDDAFAELARRVVDLAAPADAQPPRVQELFAGSGALSVLLAARAAELAAIEIDADAAAACRENLTVRGLRGHVTAADANAAPIKPVDVVVLDPPRTGAAGAAAAIAASRARAVVYVACDPPTLARDLATLAAGRFALTDLETFELFPQTSHVETVARLARRH